MPGNSFGQSFRITTAGESHGLANVVIVDGCPPGLALCEADLLADLARRRPGQSSLVSARQEPDLPRIVAGVFEGRTTGTAIAIIVDNQDARSRDYSALAQVYRPGHADFSYDKKYGLRDHRGGGRASARETVARVAAGAIAKKLLAELFDAQVLAYTSQIGDIVADVPAPEQLTLADIETNPDGTPNLVRCPDPLAAVRMVALIEQVRRERDSIGGIAQVVATGVPAGLGEPVFDKLKADLGHALFSLPAVVGVAYGAGFGAASMRGSEHNDRFVATEPDGAIRTASNRHGGMLGGISTGMPIVLNAALKPTSSLPRPQSSVTKSGEGATVTTKGRHDPCLLPRFAVIAEAMVALVLADHALRWRAQCGVTVSTNQTTDK